MDRGRGTARICALLMPALLAAGCASAPLRTTPPETDTPVRLRRIAVTSEGDISARRVVRLTGLQEGETYPPSSLSAARDTLASHLGDLAAHPLARVTRFQVLYGPRGRFADIQLTLDPGPVAVVDTIAISGPAARNADELLARMRTRAGAPFDPDTWNRDMDRVARYLEEGGYPFARVVTCPLVPDYRPASVGVRLGMEVVPGIAVTVDRVEFAGLERTEPGVARRVAAVPTGQRFDVREVEAARRRLQRTGWFSSVEPGELFRGHEGRYGLLFRVHEQSASNIAGALGYAPDANGAGVIAGNLDVQLANILGTGRVFNLTWRRDNPRLTSFSLGYREPWVFGSPLAVNVALSQEIVDSQYIALQASLGASARLGENWTLGGDVARRGVSADSLALGADSASYSLAGVEGYVELDTRDRALNPSTGGLYRARAARFWPLGGGAGTPGELLRNGLDLEQSVPLSAGWVGFAGLHADEVRPVGGGSAPVAEWARIGGVATVRGFAERSLLAPRAGWVNLELRRLLGPQSRAFLLADGAVLDTPGATRYETTYGLGTQVDTGVGLLTVAVALPTGEGFSAAVVHVRAVARF